MPVLPWTSADRPARLGFAAALVVPVALYVIFMALPGGASDGLRAVVFVAGLIAVGTLTTIPAAVACALISYAAYHVTDPSEVLSRWSGADAFLLATFVGLAVVVASRTSKARQEVEAIRLGRRNEVARRELTELLSAEDSEADIGRRAVQHLESLLGMDAALWLGGHGYVREGRAPHMAGAALRANGVGIGEGGWFWLPLMDHAGLEGAVGLRPPRGRPLEPSTVGLVRGLGTDIAHVVLRTRLANDLQREKAANESERLCTALLASVAHDLRTPLATIMASSETLRAYGKTLSEVDYQGLLQNIESESGRLDHYIQNLVDVTQMREGALDIEKDCLGAEEILGSAIVRLKRYHRDIRVVVRIDPELPPLRVHGPLLEQAVFNLLHNAAKFSPEGQPIVVTVSRADNGEVLLEVVDEGPGIPSADRERVFDMFYSADRGGKNRSGTGLGLAISQSIVRAHGGEVRADRPESGRGTVMRIQLPATAAEPSCV